MAILNGEVAQAAGTDRAGHGGQTHQADGGDGGTPRNGGDALPQVHSEDDLQRAGTHGQDGFDEAMVDLVQRTLHLTGEEGHGAHDEGDDGAGDVDGGAHDGTGEGDDPGEQDDKGDGAEEVHELIQHLRDHFLL